MKLLVTSAVIVALTLISCKKETATDNHSNVDTLSSADSMPQTSGQMSQDTLGNMPATTGTSDSSTSSERDSLTTISR